MIFRPPIVQKNCTSKRAKMKLKEFIDTLESIRALVGDDADVFIEIGPDDERAAPSDFQILAKEKMVTIL